MTFSIYETSDPYLATFLHCCGSAPISFIRVSPRRFLFRFTSDAQLHQLLRLYWNNIAMPIIPSSLFVSLHRLRSRVRGSPLNVNIDWTPPASPSPVPTPDHVKH